MTTTVAIHTSCRRAPLRASRPSSLDTLMRAVRPGQHGNLDTVRIGVGVVDAVFCWLEVAWRPRPDARCQAAKSISIQ